MRTLELRLEEWEVVALDDEATSHLWCPRFNPGAQPMALDRLIRCRAALEFFDRALPAPIAYTRLVFENAAALTRLRFGVRIVGLESAEPGEKGHA